MTRVSKDTRQASVPRIRLVNQDDKLIRHQILGLHQLSIRRSSRRDIKHGARQLSFLIERIDDFGAHLHGAIAGVQPVSIHAVCFKVLSINTQRIALHARVDVLGDEDGAQPLTIQLSGNAENQIVILVQLQRTFVLHRLHARYANDAALFVPDDAFKQMADAAQFVQAANHLARVAASFIIVLLERVQLLDHRERNDHLVLLKLEDRLRIVQQHVRVKDEILLGCQRSLRGGLGCASGFRRVVRGVSGQRAILQLAEPKGGSVGAVPAVTPVNGGRIRAVPVLN